MLAIGVLDRRSPAKRAERHAVEHELGVVGEPPAEAVPRARADGLVVRAHVVVQKPDLTRNVQFLGEQAEEDAVRPLAVPPVRAATDALADEPGPLGMADRALVEAVDLQLEPVVAEVTDEVQLEQACGLVRHPATAAPHSPLV